MQKIAKPQELQAELRRLLAYCSGPEKPSREKLAAELSALADRVAGSFDVRPEDLKPGLVLRNKEHPDWGGITIKEPGDKPGTWKAFSWQKWYTISESDLGSWEKVVKLEDKVIEKAWSDVQKVMKDIQSQLHGRISDQGDRAVDGDVYIVTVAFPGRLEPEDWRRRPHAGSWVEMRIVINDRQHSPQFGMLRIKEMSAGLEDALGNRGSEEVPGIPKDWFPPNQLPKMMKAAEGAFMKMLAQHSAKHWGKTASTNRIAGESLLDYVLDRDALIDIQSKLRDEDRQSFDLFQQVYRQLRRELTLKSGAEGAFYRILDIVKRGKTWDIALLRNNVFKAANLLGINLPSGSF